MRFRKARALLLLGGGLAGLLHVATGCEMKPPQDPSAQAFVRQIGTAQEDALAAVSGSGNYLYAAGRTKGRLPDHTGASQNTDGLLVSFDSNGMLVWQKQYGTVGNEEWRGVAVDPSGSLYVVGYTDDTFAGQTKVGGDTDAVIARIKADGTIDWVRQFGTIAADYLLAVTIDSAGNAYAAGWTAGAFPTQTQSGTSDGFVVKYRPDGTQEWLTQFGCPKEDSLNGVTMAGGSLYVTGWATDAVAAGQQALGARDAAIYKLSATGSLTWARQFGTSAVDEARAVAADNNNVYVTGSTLGALPMQASVARVDAMVAAYDVSGNQRWVRQFGTLGDDEMHGIAAAVDGSGVYVGGIIGRQFLGGTWNGQADALFSKLRSDGAQDWASQFGTPSNDAILGMFSSSLGILYTVGSTGDALSGQTRLGGDDGFIARYAVP